MGRGKWMIPLETDISVHTGGTCLPAGMAPMPDRWPESVHFTSFGVRMSGVRVSLLAKAVRGRTALQSSCGPKRRGHIFHEVSFASLRVIRGPLLLFLADA